MTDRWTDRERELLARWTPLEPPAGFADRVLGVRAPRKAWVYAGVAAAGALAVAAALLVSLRDERPRGRRGSAAPAVAPARTGSDLVVPIGESLTVHDADGTVAIRFDDQGLCRPGMRISIGSDPDLR